ncbi:MAG: response regulator transcription factor [Bacteroidota bacterium]|nr:response regulator transcription factor [Bacteroidota bacterium]
MRPSSILIADKNFLTRVGLELLVGELKGFEVVPSVCGDKKDLTSQISLSKPDIVLVDFSSLGIGIADLNRITSTHKKIKFIVFSSIMNKNEMNSVLNCRINGYLLKDCEKVEILEAINASLKGEKFVCGKIVSLLTTEKEINSNNSYIKTLKCDGLTVTEREIEIIVEIALGLSNKQIADKLHLSTHTVNTHRKNIMLKLGVNNTAGIVMFAVKNQLLETNFSL